MDLDGSELNVWEEGSFSLLDSSQTNDMLLSPSAGGAILPVIETIETKEPETISDVPTGDIKTLQSNSSTRRSRRQVVKRASYNDAGQRIYCICRKPDDGTFMIQCDQCQEWYHGHCLNLSKRQADKMNEYTCSGCLETPEDNEASNSRSSVGGDAIISGDPANAATKPSKRKGSDVPPTVPKKQKSEVLASPTNSIPTTEAVKSLDLQTSSSSNTEQKLDRIREIARKGFLGTFTHIFEKLKSSPNEMFEDPFIDDIDFNDPESFSIAVETALFEAFSTANKEGKLVPSDQYKGKYRSLQFNLKDLNNHRLHARLFTKHISHLRLAELVRLPPEELGNDQVKAAVAEIRQTSLKNAFKPQNDGIMLTKKTHKGEVEVESPHVGIGPSTLLSHDVVNSERNISPLDLLNSLQSNSKSSLDTEEGSFLNESTASTSEASPHTTVVESTLAGMVTGLTAGSIGPELDKVLAKMDEPSGTGSLDDISAMFGNSNDVVVPINEDPSRNRYDETEAFAPLSPVDHAHTPNSPLPGDDSPVADAFVEQYDDIIWSGKVSMPQVSKFTGFARQIVGERVGNALDWEDVLSLAIPIEGRIASTRVTKYVMERIEHGSRMAVIEFFPQGFKSHLWKDKVEDAGEAPQVKGYDILFEYFFSRDRFAVIGQTYTAVRDMYIIPVKAGQSLPSFLQGIAGENMYRMQPRNRLLGLIIFSRDFGKPSSSSHATRTSRQSSTASLDSKPSKSQTTDFNSNLSPASQLPANPVPQQLPSSLLGLPSLLGVGAGLIPPSTVAAGTSSSITGSLDLNLIQSLLAAASNVNPDPNYLS